MDIEKQVMRMENQNEAYANAADPIMREAFMKALEAKNAKDKEEGQDKQATSQ